MSFYAISRRLTANAALPETEERRFVVAAFIALENAPIDTPILGHNIAAKIQNGLFYTDPLHNLGAQKGPLGLACAFPQSNPAGILRGPPFCPQRLSPRQPKSTRTRALREDCGEKGLNIAEGF